LTPFLSGVGNFSSRGNFFLPAGEAQGEKIFPREEKLPKVLKKVGQKMTYFSPK